MIQLSHSTAESAIAALAKRSPELATSLEIAGPIRREGDPEVVTNKLIESFRAVIGVEPTDPKRIFIRSARFEVPQGFPVDQHREMLAGLLKQVLDGQGEVLTRDNLDW